MAKILKTLFELQLNVKLFHWFTKSYAKHSAADKLYNELITLTDTFVETYIGKFGRDDIKAEMRSAMIPLSAHDERSIVPLINRAISQMNSMPVTLKLTASDTDLLTIRDEIIAKLNQTKYLLTLE